MRIGALLLVVWLVIGAAAAVQRDYFSGSSVNCAKAGTIAVTVLAGPLNYLACLFHATVRDTASKCTEVPVL
jgi:hypothetical protein